MTDIDETWDAKDGSLHDHRMKHVHDKTQAGFGKSAKADEPEPDVVIPPEPDPEDD